MKSLTSAAQRFMWGSTLLPKVCRIEGVKGVSHCVTLPLKGGEGVTHTLNTPYLHLAHTFHTLSDFSTV